MLTAGSQVEYRFQSGDAGYLVPATGEIEVNGMRIHAREGVLARDEDTLVVQAVTHAELVLVVTAI